MPIVKCVVCGTVVHKHPAHMRDYASRFCSMKCYGVWRHNESRRKSVIIDRFWKYVEIGKEDDCWLWTGVKAGSNGYGQFWFYHKGKRVKPGAHIFSYVIHFGSLRGLLVLHKCDNPLCVNPNHLFLGTQKDNVRDMMAKGRGLIGEKNPRSKITETDVREIFRLYNDGYTYREIEEYVGINRKHVGLVIQGKCWSHLGLVAFVRERNRALKLCERDVRYIKYLLFYTDLSKTEIGLRFGVSRTTIIAIERGQTWNHIRIGYQVLEDLVRLGVA